MYAISNSGAPEAIGAASQGTSAARFVFISGQIPLDPETNQMVETSVQDKASQCISNIKLLLNELDLTFGDVTKTTVYLTNLDDLEAIDEIWEMRFPKPWPARSVVQVQALPQGATMMVEAVACR